MKIVAALLCALFLNAAPPAGGAKNTPKGGISGETLAGLKFRSIGPALTSGRIASVAVVPSDRSTWYVAAASGGVWKTSNSGTTWSPLFDGEGSYSIGCVTPDPSDPAVVWVGTGENNSQRSVSYGDGVYRSSDGGKSWKNLGLKHSEHIARILVDPRASSTVYVAAQGPLWGPGGDRGLFKSTDGGASWKNILDVSENTGVTDVVMHPKNPDVLIAATYQRRRHVWTLIDGGPESGIRKSTDGGATWTKLASGLPAGDLGRIGLAIAPSDPRVVYASVEASNKKGGIFRSTDGGATWEKRNDFDASAMYYGTIYADPRNPDRVYVMSTFLMVSDDGGKTLHPLGEKSKHVDNHCMWIEPENPAHYLVGCDGGLYESYDRGLSWRYFANLPVTQFYDVDVDNDAPFYNVYGGTQDNFSLGGPSRTRSASGIVNSDWVVTTGGDGFQSRIDPEDPNTVYAESQYGGLVRFDRRSGEQTGIQPQAAPGEEPLRWNWDSPIIISPHLHTRLYFAANKLFRSDDRGDTWKPVSGDLTRKIDRNALPVMGKVWGVDAVAKSASTSFYGNCTALSESPGKEGLIYAGTDDGLIHVTEDGGKGWRMEGTFPGVPPHTYVSRLLASRSAVQTVFAAFDNHKNADFAPYLLKSNDAGKSWSSIAGDLPANGPVLAIAEDDADPDLIFAGTEFGLYVTVDGGGHWVQMKGGLPTIAVRDIAVQRREHDLVLATFGRGFYILDDYTPLRGVTPALLAGESHLFPVKDAPMYIQAQPLGGTKKSFQGESYFTAPNPPFGAVFTYFLRDAVKTKREQRQEAEKDAKNPLPYPTMEQLRAEDEEEPPSVILTVADTAGNVIRKVTGPAGKGFARVSWDLRYPAPVLSAPSPDEEPEGGQLVMPGTYTASLALRQNGVLRQLAGPVRFNVIVPGQSTMNPADRRALADFQGKVAGLQRAVSGALQSANDLKNRLGAIRKALMETAAPVDPLIDTSLAMERETNGILRSLRGDQTLRSRNEISPLSVSERVNAIVDDERLSTAAPTTTHRDIYAAAGDEFTQLLTQLHSLIEQRLQQLEKGAEAAGAPWTSGRVPVWRKE